MKRSSGLKSEMLIKGVSRSKPRGRSVERRPVNRPLSANEHAFQDRTIEVEQKGQEAVVSKQARVTEEVVVNKDV